MNNTFYENEHGKFIIDHIRRNKSITGKVQLDEFFTFVTHPHLRRDDVHWAFYHQLCLPCYIDYDYIGKLEDGPEMANYVIEKTTRKSGVNFPETKPASYNNYYNKLLKTLPKQLLRRIFTIYNIDFKLFDYSN